LTGIQFCANLTSVTKEEQIRECRTGTEPKIGSVYCRKCFRYQQPKNLCKYSDPRDKRIVGRERPSERSKKEKWVTDGEVAEGSRKK